MPFSFRRPRVRLTDITDGTSNTLLLSEGLIPRSPMDNDWRGDIYNDDGVFKFMTIVTPNSSSPDVVGRAVADPNDTLAPVTTAGAQQSAARSRHSGGVNVAFADGSIRFIANTVNLTPWRAIGTMAGGEPSTDY